MNTNSIERLKIRIDATIRRIGIELAIGQDGYNAGMSNPFLGRNENKTAEKMLTDKVDVLTTAVRKGLNANSYSVYRQNLD